MAKPALALAVAFVMVACGAVSASPGNHPKPSPPTAALDRWKDFPANAHPRPIISFDDTTELIQPGGFPTGDRKMAWVCRKFVLAAGLIVPAAAPAQASAGGASYPAIGAARAWTELMSQAAGGNPTDCAAAHAFVIASVRWGTEGFPTDRGTMQMSAWLYDVPEVNGHLAHSAVDPTAYWGGAVIKSGGRGARVSADGRTLSIAVGNAEPGPCGFDYTASVAESASAVAIAVKQYPHPQPDQSVVCLASLRLSYITVDLQAGLGGRVLVDENGNVGAVLPG